MAFNKINNNFVYIMEFPYVVHNNTEYISTYDIRKFCELSKKESCKQKWRRNVNTFSTWTMD